jgi:hypothetical protein
MALENFSNYSSTSAGSASYFGSSNAIPKPEQPLRQLSADPAAPHLGQPLELASSNFNFPNMVIPPQPSTEDPSSLDLATTLDDMNRWADRRISIFASLDAALSKAVVEAASALNEIKERTEEEARIVTKAIVTERERLQTQVEELRLERVRLQDQLTQAQRETEAEQLRKLAIEREAQLVLEEAQRERDRVQLEINQLSRQMEGMGQQLQVFFQQRFTDLWEQFAKSVAERPSRPLPVPSVEDVFGGDFNPVVFQAQADLPLEVEIPLAIPTMSLQENIAQVDEGATKIKSAVTRQEFEDAPTPKSNIIPLLFAEQQPETPTTIEPKLEPKQEVSLLPIEKVVFNQDHEVEVDESDFLRIFQAPLASPVAVGAPADSGSLEEVGAGTGVEAGANVLAGNRQEAARQHVERLFSKRRAEVSAAKVEPPSKQVFVELGAKLGLEALTPPPLDQIIFAEGFTPPPEVGKFLASRGGAIGVGSKATAAYQQASVSSNSNSSKKQVEASAPATLSLEEIFARIPADLPVEDEGTPLWADEAPSIGELGPDLARRWDQSDFLPNSEQGSSANSLADINTGAVRRNDQSQARSNNKATDKLADTSVSARQAKANTDRLPSAPLKAPSSMSAANGFGTFPNFPVMPAMVRIPKDIHAKQGIMTQVYVSNLQGLGLLTIEKVVRSLPGVYQVVVTTLEKGEIGMEVRHNPELELNKVLPNLPDFRLKLVERGENMLKFMQMR